MDDIQRTHRPTGIVKEPLILARVEDDALLRGRIFGSEVRDDVRDDRSSVVGNSLPCWSIAARERACSFAGSKTYHRCLG